MCTSHVQRAAIRDKSEVRLRFSRIVLPRRMTCDALDRMLSSSIRLELAQTPNLIGRSHDPLCTVTVACLAELKKRWRKQACTCRLVALRTAVLMHGSERPHTAMHFGCSQASVMLDKSSHAQFVKRFVTLWTQAAMRIG